MIELFIAGFFQFLFQLSRTVSTRLIAKDNIPGTLFMTSIIQALWLLTTAIGVEAYMNEDWYIIAAYMLGGLLGAYVAMKIKLSKEG